MRQAYADKILLVDDESNLLSGVERQLRTTFNLYTAQSGKEGLKIIETKGPFSVVVSDMRMPEMNGIQFLVQVGKISPDSVRMMLTGNADLETAMHAVNEGNIFRFLTKPCQKQTMEWAFADGIRQYRLIMAERELLEHTLKGSIEVLSSILELINPLAFSKTSRVTNYVTQVSQLLAIGELWQLQLAAMLSQLGCVAIPSDTLAKVYAGAPLSESEDSMYKDHPKLGSRLIQKIPRLAGVAAIIADQLDDKPLVAGETDSTLGNANGLGHEILRAVLEFDQCVMRGMTPSEAVGSMKSNKKGFLPQVVQVLREVKVAEYESQTKLVNVSDLNESMTLAEPVFTNSGVLLAAKEQRVTHSLCKLLRNHHEQGSIHKSVTVRISAGRITKEESATLHIENA